MDHRGVIAKMWQVAAAVFVLAAGTAAEAQLFYWAGADGDVKTAGSGTWDANTSVVWRESSDDGTLVKWTDHRTAIFQGRSGGTVKLADAVTVSAIEFLSAAGAFTIASSGSSVVVAGDGISNDSEQTQTLSMQMASLAFSGNASAGAGLGGSRVQISSDGLTTFADSATAGRATITNGGEMHFAGKSSAGACALVNSSLLIFQDDATADAAAITNGGLVQIQDSARDLARAAFSNGTGGSIDLTGLTPPGVVSLGALTNGPGAAVILGSNQLAISQLNLAGGNDLNFDLGRESAARITVASSLIVSGAKTRTRITINDAGGLTHGSSYPLIEWPEAAFVSGVKAGAFALQPLPGGFSGRLRVLDRQLILEVNR